MSRIPYKLPDRTKLNQEGMASILVVLIMSVVISLIVVGFSQVSTREQANALNNQLSTTAYYAAESGINDAIGIIKGPNPNNFSYAKNSCGYSTSDPLYTSLYNSKNTSQTNFGYDNTSVGGATYSCLLVNPNPNELITNISSNSQVIPVNVGGSSVINVINLIWNNPNAGASTTSTWNSSNSDCALSASSPQFPSSSSWNCGLGVIRMDLVPISQSLSENSLLTSTMSAFIIPNNSSSTITFTPNSSSSNPPVYGSSCTAATGCKVSITGLPRQENGSAVTEYYVRLSMIYGGSNVLVLNATDSTGKSLPLSGAEYIIDSTGLANGVSRRIQVAVPIVQATNVPGYSVQTTTDICKRFYIIPSSVGGSGDPVASIVGSGSGDCTANGF